LKGCKKQEWSRQYSWTPISRRPTGRTKIHWEDDVRRYTEVKVPNWKTLVQDRRWKELVEKAKTLHKEL